MTQPMLVVTSHDDGRNAKVTLWPDRIERVREKSRTSLSRARQDTEVTPVRSVSSVQAKKDGIRYTKVIVFASGNNIEFRLGHDEAQRFKDALMHLVLNGGGRHYEQAAPVAAQAAAAPEDPMVRLERIVKLKDAGVLSDEEFSAQKAAILGGGQGEAPIGAWHPDPLGRHQLRYFDGSSWTPNVSDHGVTSQDATGL